MRKFSFLTVILAASVFVVPAIANPVGFSGYYAQGNWNITNNQGDAPSSGLSVDFSGAPDSITINGGVGGEIMSIIAPESGTVSFSYSFTDYSNSSSGIYVTIGGWDNWFQVSDFTPTGSTSTGSYSFAVNQDEIFGIGVGTWTNDVSPGTISDFDAPVPVPEPSSFVLFALAGVALGLLRRIRACSPLAGLSSRIARPRTLLAIRH